MKNATRYCAGSSLLQDVLNRRLLFKTNFLAAVIPKGNYHPSFLRFWNWAEENWSMQPKFVAAQKNVVKTETQQTFVNGLLGFITLGIYTVSACSYAHNIRMSCSSIWQLPFALLINSTSGFLPGCFCIVISSL